jgi:hypothetical protein
MIRAIAGVGVGFLLAASGALGAPVCPLKEGQTYKYQLAVGGNAVGAFTLTCAKAPDGSKTVTSKMDAKIQGAQVTVDATAIVGEDLRPTSYTSKGDLGPVAYSYTCTFSADDGKVVTKGQKKGVPISSTVELPDGWEFFDNNDMACFSLMAARLGVEPNVVKTAQCFHGFSGQVMQCTLEFKGQEDLTVGGKTYKATKCELGALELTQWLAEDGLLLKGSQGPASYTLMP